MIIWVCSGHI